MALHWFGGYVSSFFPHGFFSFGFSYPAVSQGIISPQSISCCYCSTCMWFLLAAGVRPKETKINLMDCICLCSEVEIDCFENLVLVKLIITDLLTCVFFGSVPLTPNVDLFEPEHPKKYQNRFLTPKRYDEHQRGRHKYANKLISGFQSGGEQPPWPPQQAQLRLNQIAYQPIGRPFLRAKSTRL